MKNGLVLCGLVVGALAACSNGSGGSGGSGGGSGGGGLTPGAGYANDTLAIDIDGETIDTGAVLLTRTNLSTFTNEELDLTLTTTSNANEYLMTYNGSQYTLTLTSDPSGREFEYVDPLDPNFSVNFYLNFDSDRSQLVAGWLNVTDLSASPSKEYLGTGIFGFTTDPAIVAARTGTADYLGQGNINVQVLGSSPHFTSGFGHTNLTANFNNNTISGTITGIAEIGSSQTGHELVGSTSATINQASISNGTIAGSITLADPNKFGLLSQGTVTYDGKFYESYGTGVGAYITGNGATASDGTTPAIISGAFVAEECPTPSGSC